MRLRIVLGIATLAAGALAALLPRAGKSDGPKADLILTSRAIPRCAFSPYHYFPQREAGLFSQCMGKVFEILPEEGRMIVRVFERDWMEHVFPHSRGWFVITWPGRDSEMHLHTEEGRRKIPTVLPRLEPRWDGNRWLGGSSVYRHSWDADFATLTKDKTGYGSDKDIQLGIRWSDNRRWIAYVTPPSDDRSAWESGTYWETDGETTRPLESWLKPAFLGCDDSPSDVGFVCRGGTELHIPRGVYRLRWDFTNYPNQNLEGPKGEVFSIRTEEPLVLTHDDKGRPVVYSKRTPWIVRFTKDLELISAEIADLD